MTLSREVRRLRRAFGAVLLTVGPAAAIEACGTSPLPANLDVNDASPLVDVSIDADADSPGSVDARPAPDARCSADMTTEILDAGPDAPADADQGCRYTMPCGIQENSGFEIVGCGLYRLDASLGCFIPEGKGCTADAYAPQPSGSVTIECLDCFGGGGRRLAGLRAPRRVRTRSPVGGYFARMAHDEAASVHAFVAMEADLVRFEAPSGLISAARRAARDELRHARFMARRARSCGGSVPRVRVTPRPASSLEEMALENAVEGCVNETYGALQMLWQAMYAQDASLRSPFARIARDESRHAALSWKVASWAERRLGADARRRVAAARTDALHELRRKLGDPSTHPFDRLVGRPDGATSVALLDRMHEALSRRA